jgi:hypothetical protein
MSTLSLETTAHALPILREAIAATERLEGLSSDNARFAIGTYIRSLGLAEEFGHYGQGEVDTAEASHRPEWHQARKELQEIEAEAARKLRSRDFVGARETYRSAEEQREVVFNELHRFGDFLGWLLDVGGIDLTREFRRSAEWAKVFWHPSHRLGETRRLAKALIAAGHRPEGVELLRELHTSLDSKSNGETSPRSARRCGSKASATKDETFCAERRTRPWMQPSRMNSFTGIRSYRWPMICV